MQRFLGVYFCFLSSFLFFFFFSSASWVTVAEFGRKKQKKIKKSKQQLGFSVLKFWTYEPRTGNCFYKSNAYLKFEFCIRIFIFEIWIFVVCLNESLIVLYGSINNIRRGFYQSSLLLWGVLSFAKCNRSLHMHQLLISSSVMVTVLPPLLLSLSGPEGLSFCR